MEKNQNANQQLMKSFQEPDKRIIQNWPTLEKRTIEIFHTKKICEFVAQDFNELEKKLILLQEFTQQTELLSDNAMGELIEYLLNFFPNVSIEEIDHAVKMSAAGKIFDDKGQPVKAEHYGKFGAIYLSNILNPYQNYRGSVVRKYYDEEDKLREKETAAARPQKTPEEQRETMVWFAISCFNSFKDKQPTVALDRVYDFLQKEKLINISEEKKREYEKEGTEIVKREAKAGDRTAKSILQVIEGASGMDIVIMRAKGLAVKAYFRQLIEENKDLAEILISGNKSPC